MRDFSNDLTDIRRRVDEAAVYLKVAAGKERMVELEVDVARPDLWDDQDNAKKVNAEYANLKTDLEDFRQLASSVEDLEVLHEMAREVDDETQEPELERGISLAKSKLDALELRSLFTGVHDEADAIVQINAKDGGVDAQDWSEMLLRMFTRWAERKAFSLSKSATFHSARKRAFCLPTSQFGGATPMACSHPSAAHTDWFALAHSTTRVVVKQALRPSRFGQYSTTLT
jgi:peptide chain release factor 2